MEVWAGKRQREIEEEEENTQGTKRAREGSDLPAFKGHDLDTIEDAAELFWSVVYGCAPPEPGEDQTPPRLPKGKLNYFKKIDPAYKHVDTKLNGDGIIVAEDATAPRAWLEARGLSPKKTWKRFYTVTLATYHYRLLLANEIEQRCCYEVLREHSPCHAYADVEIYPSTNPRMQTMEQFNEFMDIFLGIFEGWLEEYLNVEIRRYTLESSGYDRDTGKPTKFSRHYKWLLSYGPTNYAMFLNVAQVGALMRRFECYLIKTYGPSTRDGNIFYFWKEKIKHSPPDPFKDKTQPFDQGVYTNNRMYRFGWNQKIGSGRPLLPYGEKGEDVDIENPSLDDTIRYSLLCPPREACGNPLHLLTVTEPDGSAAKSTSNLYAHRAAQHPRHISVHSNGTAINDSHLSYMEDFISYDDDGDDDEDTDKPLCRGTEWNGRNGTSKKPPFCTPMSSMFCAAFSDKLAEWGRRKNRTVPKLKMDHADFNRDRMQFVVTFKNYCHVLHADPKSNTVKHRSNRGYFRINLTDMTYVCHCLDPDHRSHVSVPQNVMDSVKEKFGKRVEKFIAAFNTRHGLDAAREMFSLFDQLQTGSYTLSEPEEDEEETGEAYEGDRACQGTMSG